MDVNEIQQSNDIEPSAIPADLMDLIHAPLSVDPEPEEVEQTQSEITVDVVKVSEENPQSRFTILDTPIKKPGVCALCGDSGGDGRQFVDFGKSVEWYGVVYFCTVCVVEAARLLGLTVSQESFDGMVRGYREEVESGDDRWVKSQEEIRALNVLLRDHLNGNCCTHVPVDEIPEAELIEPSDSDGLDSEAGDAKFEEPELPSGSDESSDGNEQDADELAPEQRSDDVSESASNDKPVASKPRRRTTKSNG